MPDVDPEALRASPDPEAPHAGPDPEARVRASFAKQGLMRTLGATLGGGADTDRASVALRTLSDKAKRDIALSILRDVLHQPRFDAAIFEREKARTIAGLKEAQTRPDSIAGKAFWAAMYPNHPYGRVIPDPAAFEQFDAEAARTFWAAQTGAQRAHLLVFREACMVPGRGRGDAAEILHRRQHAAADDSYFHAANSSGVMGRNRTRSPVSSSGDFSATDAHAGTETQRIVLDNVDLVARLGAGLSEQQLIAKLVEQGKLLVDA